MDVIRHFRDYIEAAPDDLTAYAALLHAPDGAPLVGVIACYCGETADGERVLKPLGAREITITTPEQFRKVVANLIEEMSVN